MMLFNKLSVAVSRKLPDGTIVTLQPGESFDFPDLPIYNEDERLGGWSKPSSTLKPKTAKKPKKPKKKKTVNKQEFDPLDVNKDGVVDGKDVLSVASKAVKNVFKKKPRKGKK